MAQFFLHDANGNLLENNTQNYQASMAPIDALMGQYRDIPQSIIQNYVTQKTSLEDTLAAIKGTPVYNPTIGPQYDAGAGVKTLTPDRMNAAPGMGFNTPEGQQNQINFLSEQAQGIKKALEATANSGGAGLGSNVPTRSGTGLADPSTAPATPDNFNFFEEYKKQFGARPTPPGPVDMTSVTTAENDLNNSRSSLAALENKILTEKQGIQSTPGLTRAYIGGELRSIDANTAEALRNARQAVTDASNNLSAKTAAVKMLMDQQHQTYQDASAAWDKQYADAFDVFKLNNTADSKQQTQANAQIKAFVGMFKGQIPTLTPDMQAQIGQWEVQAGVQPGYTLAMLKAQAQSGVKVTHWVTNKGTTYAYGTDSKGNPILLKSFYSGGTSTPAPKAPTLTVQQATSKMASALQNTINDGTRKDSYLSPQEWSQAKSDWVGAGYSASTFNSNFKMYQNPNDTYN